jgi:aspartate--ammonia ligase
MSREQTEEKIKQIKDTFERKLAYELNLLRVSGPIFVSVESNINDDLGNSNPVTFNTQSGKLQVVQSLAKWKRMRLKDFDSSKYQGIYVDMNAIRPDETPDNLHSIYVDQWDWEKIINESDRTKNYLEETVSIIHKVINSFFDINKKYPENVCFINSKDLYDLYPAVLPKSREYLICKEQKVVFIERIGWPLPDGKPHDLRAADYDDWQLNGDLLYWSDAIQAPIEISSMGIRVDRDSLFDQLNYVGKNNIIFQKCEYYEDILNKNVPYTIGGGIGQSRLCMLILQKKHIGEVQASVWPKEMIDECKRDGIELL